MAVENKDGKETALVRQVDRGDPDEDLGDKCGGGGRDKCLEVRVWSRFRLESIYI